MIKAIRDAIVASLNGETFSQTFTAAAEWAPSENIANEALRVLVVHFQSEITRADRSTRYFDHTYHIGIQKKLAAATVAAVDPIVELLEEIDAHLVDKAATLAGARWKEASIVTTAVPEQLRALRLETAVLSVTYRAHQ